MAVALPVLNRAAANADDQLVQRIRQQLVARSGWAASRLSVDVQEGVATLRGVADSYYQKQLWLHGTQHIPGVVGIHDEITVRSAFA
jgi:osmotically-inducible protein OsmY